MLPERADWKLAFGGSVGIIEKILAFVQPELQASYTRNTYVLYNVYMVSKLH